MIFPCWCVTNSNLDVELMKHLQSLHWLFPTEENKFAKPVRKEPQSADARTSTFNQLRIRHRAGLPVGFMQYSAPWKGATLPASKRIQLRCWLWSVWNESTINFLKERWGSSCHACSAGGRTSKAHRGYVLSLSRDIKYRVIFNRYILRDYRIMMFLWRNRGLDKLVLQMRFAIAFSRIKTSLIKIVGFLLNKVPIGKSPAVIRAIAWQRLGDKHLREPLMNQFTDDHVRHRASKS